MGLWSKDDAKYRRQLLTGRGQQGHGNEGAVRVRKCDLKEKTKGGKRKRKTKKRANGGKEPETGLVKLKNWKRKSPT